MNFEKQGNITFNKHLGNVKENSNVERWTGPFTLNGRAMHVIAIVNRNVSKKAKPCSVKILDPEAKWKTVTEFQIGRFDPTKKTPYQDIKTSIGVIRAHPGIIRTTNEPCVRLTLLDEKGNTPSPGIF